MLLRRVLILSLISALFIGERDAVAQTGLATLEVRFERADSLLRATLSHRDSLAAKAAKLASEISELKAGGDLNYFQRSRLESLLRDSQQLSRGLEAAERQISEYDRSMREIGNDLLDAYGEAIQEKVSGIERASATARSSLTAELELLRKRQARLQGRLAQSYPRIRLVTVEIDSQDTPSEIRRKADLLRDQADKLSARRTWLQKKAKEIASEVDLRRRMSEFVDEVTLLDPTDEGLSGDAVQAAAKGVPAEAVPSNRLSDVQAGQPPATGLFLSPRQWEGLVNPGQLSDSELRTLLKTLEKEGERLASQADSLGQVARDFNKRAKAFEGAKQSEPE